MLRRKVTKQFEEWRQIADSKALLVLGARQIGKSYAIREFGKGSYTTFIEINLYKDARARTALLEAQTVTDFISRVSIISGTPLGNGDALVFIDEIQEAPEIMTMVKFLVEDARCHWAFSGSMLGTEFKNVRSYPVGSVHEIVMRPLDWEEFCWALNTSDEALQTVRTCCKSCTEVPGYLHDSLMSNFRTYLVVGGMPEAVTRLIDTKGDLAAVREVQADLNKQYRRDISKYAGARALQVQGIYDQLPVQLEGDSQRFVLSSIDPSARYEKYQRDFIWLQSAGVALKTEQVDEPKSPLRKTANAGKFKLYQSDTGMLLSRYPLDIAQATYLDEREPNLGGVYENAVAQELAAQGHELFYYQTKKRGEVNFVVDGPHGKTVALEVKSGRYYHAHAALDNVLETQGYGVDLGIVLSRGNVERDGKALYLPLYALFVLPEYLKGDRVVGGSFKMAIAQV